MPANIPIQDTSKSHQFLWYATGFSSRSEPKLCRVSSHIYTNSLFFLNRFLPTKIYCNQEGAKFICSKTVVNTCKYPTKHVFREQEFHVFRAVSLPLGPGKHMQTDPFELVHFVLDMAYTPTSPAHLQNDPQRRLRRRQMRRYEIGPKDTRCKCLRRNCHSEIFLGTCPDAPCMEYLQYLHLVDFGGKCR